MVGTETNPPLALENYNLVEKLPYVIGYFVWTATDNIGEAGVGMPQLRISERLIIKGHLIPQQVPTCRSARCPDSNLYWSSCRYAWYSRCK